LRQVLHGALLSALHTTEIRSGARAVGFHQTAAGVEVELASGERLAGDVLIGADGLHSRLRALMHPDAVRPSGLVGYRGVVRDTSWAISGAQYFGRGVEAGVGRASPDAVYWYVSARRDPAQSSLSPRAAVLETIRGFDPALIDLVERTQASDVRCDELVDRKPLASWSQQRVTLLGDAAHPMLPHAGQGAAQALEDAVVLGRCLGGTRDITGALRRYEALRVPRANQVVAIARRNSRAAGLQSRVLCTLRNLVLEHGPSTLIEKQLLTLSRFDLEA
jgi:2-polyprenyl-6-methoxyphenol hydroxylase-like FAD-dependent oxidoreductase